MDSEPILWVPRELGINTQTTRCPGHSCILLSLLHTASVSISPLEAALSCLGRVCKQNPSINRPSHNILSQTSRGANPKNYWDKTWNRCQMSVPRSKSTDPFQTADTYTLCLLLPGTHSELPPFSLDDSWGIRVQPALTHSFCFADWEPWGLLLKIQKLQILSEQLRIPER